MRLLVCWGTFRHPGGHPCEAAYTALREAGHDPEVVRAYGSAVLPDAIFNRSPGRGRPSDGRARWRCPCS